MRRSVIATLFLVALAGCDKGTQEPTNGSAAKGKTEVDAKAEADVKAETKSDTKTDADAKADEAETSCDGCQWYEAATPDDQKRVSHHTPLPAEAGCYRREPHPHAQMHMETKACASKCCPGH